MLLGSIFVIAGLLFQAQPAPPADNWRVLVEQGKQAYAKQAYADAISRLTTAAELAAAAEDGKDKVFDVLRLLAAVHQGAGNFAEAEQILKKVVEQSRPDSPNVAMAANLEQLASIHRAQGHSEQALAAIDRAVGIREQHADSNRSDLARDLTTSGLLLINLDLRKGAARLQEALREWDTASPGDPQALPAIEALAALYRDGTQYAEAEPLLLRALRIREAATGPDSAEVISTVDSLAYIEFGLKNYSQAEPYYRRLLALWERHGGPDHPMTALTLDKLAEFFAAQQRYEEAEQAANTALAARSRMYLGSLNQAGRMLLMQAKLSDAEDHFRRAVQIGDLAKAPDEVLDPVLRIYAKILTALERGREAESVEVRIKDALFRKGEREGRRPSPVQPSH